MRLPQRSTASADSYLWPQADGCALLCCMLHARSARQDAGSLAMKGLAAVALILAASQAAHGASWLPFNLLQQAPQTSLAGRRAGPDGLQAQAGQDVPAWQRFCRRVPGLLTRPTGTHCCRLSTALLAGAWTAPSMSC